jgi:hypothetical protein
MRIIIQNNLIQLIIVDYPFFQKLSDHPNLTLAECPFALLISLSKLFQRFVDAVQKALPRLADNHLFHQTEC